MRRLRSDRAITLGFIAFAFALAFWQHPGWATADTKIDLHVDPGRFLAQVAAAWAPTGDLGEVHSAQYSGYLWPMGPAFALLHAAGLGAWVVERIWIGLLFALSVWGLLRLLDALIGRPRGAAHVVAAAFYLLNPYVTVFTARTTITLLGYAALPWLLLITHHGLRTTRGWRGWRPWWWAGAFALVLTSTGGGVNAAVVGWMLVGPLVLLLYEPAVGTVRWRDSAGFLVRVGVLGVLASLWWIVPVLVHVKYGIDFLQFTEQPGTIWGTNSITESLRLMGYWTSYIGVGFGVSRPFFSDGGTLLFSPLVVGASRPPALAVAGFVRARRLSYGPFLLLLVLVGAAIETAGFPDGTPVRGTMDWIYHHIFVLSFMRTTNKAAPLVAVGVAGLLGIGSAHALRRIRALDGVRVRRAGLVAAPVVVVALLVLAALPLIRGQAIDTQLSYKKIPAAWTQAAQGLDRTLPANARAIVLPGQIFGYYTWGGTLDAILPRLTSKPVAVRYETPYSDLHAVDLLTTVDDLVQQNRLVPGELTPLLRLIGARAVITGADDDISRSGALDPASAAQVLAGQGLDTPSQSYGPGDPPPAGRGGHRTGRVAAAGAPLRHPRRPRDRPRRPGGEPHHRRWQRPVAGGDGSVRDAAPHGRDPLPRATSRPRGCARWRHGAPTSWWGTPTAARSSCPSPPSRTRAPRCPPRRRSRSAPPRSIRSRAPGPTARRCRRSRGPATCARRSSPGSSNFPRPRRSPPLTAACRAPGWLTATCRWPIAGWRSASPPPAPSPTSTFTRSTTPTAP